MWKGIGEKIRHKVKGQRIKVKGLRIKDKGRIIYA
jgi:hypothetical protein